MSEIRIKVTSDKLRQAMNRFNTCKEEMAQAYRQMSSEVKALSSTWEGEASQAFMSRFDELIANISTSDATIDQAVAGLEAAAQAYENAESGNVKIGQNMRKASTFRAGL